MPKAQEPEVKVESVTIIVKRSDGRTETRTIMNPVGALWSEARPDDSPPVFRLDVTGGQPE